MDLLSILLMMSFAMQKLFSLTYGSPPLIMEYMLQNPQWKSETLDCSKTYLHYIFPMQTCPW
jgi:hypothetical protein